nr:UDP-glycosyltransferase 73C3-like [Ipomoea batatas]
MSDEFQNWLRQEKYEERVKEQQGLVIYGWAPQVLILSHPSIGGFLTHCGWNSSLEAITSGLPLITWPLFAEQFLNERLIVNVLKIGVRVGMEFPVLFGAEEQTGVQVNRDDIVVAIDEVMGRGEEAEMRRERMKKLGEMARRAMEEGVAIEEVMGGGEEAEMRRERMKKLGEMSRTQWRKELLLLKLWLALAALELRRGLAEGGELDSLVTSLHLLPFRRLLLLLHRWRLVRHGCCVLADNVIDDNNGQRYGAFASKLLPFGTVLTSLVQAVVRKLGISMTRY